MYRNSRLNKFLEKLGAANSEKKTKSNNYTDAPTSGKSEKPTLSPQLSVVSGESDIYEDVSGLQPPPYSEAYDMPRPYGRPVDVTTDQGGIYTNVNEAYEAVYEDMGQGIDINNPVYVNKP